MRGGLNMRFKPLYEYHYPKQDDSGCVASLTVILNDHEMACISLHVCQSFPNAFIIGQWG